MRGFFMIISVTVATRAKQERIRQQPDGSYKIWVRAVPEHGRANERVIRLLAEHFNIPPSRVTITRGAGASRKIIRIDADGK